MAWAKTGEIRDGEPVLKWVSVEAARVATRAYFESRLAEPQAPPTELVLSNDNQRMGIRLKAEPETPEAP